jgi:hypothetical protein
MIELTSPTAWPVMAAISISVAPARANRETAVPRRSWKVRPLHQLCHKFCATKRENRPMCRVDDPRR